MKNILVIDIDTERKPQVKIRKPTDTQQPTNVEEAKQMVLTDVAAACEGLLTLINAAHQNKYADKTDLVNTAKKYLDDLLKLDVVVAKPVEG